ncbi:4-hydroxybenzoate octaprenyltransferase [Sessilibacter corallicola]|uniref:4-hydroxybenzoate octaprenyltransferase n=1 Tax=Sessilibacter corallicola TaxID=2904075 RepID=UPI001E3413D4|nr:4-hydroxybenzoate octaprenyltransferase [Sessilibacter corallicola]MCE2027901.1 4-hydroxybenzoate octaprenyltransferase [Sessilibacter corallicola]
MIVEKYLQPKSGNWNDYLALMRMDKPVGTLLVLWPVLWSLWLASDGSPSVKNLVIFVLGVFVMRSAGCVINDYADRNFDGSVKRTKQRPLASGKLSEQNALSLFFILCLVALLLVLLTNWMTVALSVGALILASVYPFAKRHTHLPQIVLGAAFSWSIPMVFTAETGTVSKEIWLIYFVNLLWVVAYDTYYAMVDRDDDLKIGVKSTAVLFAEMDKTIIGFLQVLVVIGLLMIGSQFNLGGIYILGVVITAGLFVYQQWITRDREREKCFAAFKNNQWVGLVIFIFIALDYLF